jgi:hypothetical protein
MADQHTAADHHDAAAQQHDQAMKLHRSASRHYQIGKDYAHAAHQALAAHGHGMLALASAEAALQQHQPHDGHAHDGMSAPAQATPVAPVKLQSCCSDSHAAAADAHEMAAAEHAKASDHCGCGNKSAAAEGAKTAKAHGDTAVKHSNEAARQHAVRHNAPHAPKPSMRVIAL